MQIKISDDNLSILKLSLNDVEKEYFNNLNFSYTICDVIIHGTLYTYEVIGNKAALFDFLNNMSFQFDIELT